MDPFLPEYLANSLKVRGRTLHSRMVLSPMAGLGHVAFRRLVAEFGGFGLLFTGMCSAKAVPHENPDISHVFKWRKEELGSLVCQIFGPDPQIMAKAAVRIEKEGFFGVDLNFGCAVAAICKKGCGAALLKNPELAAAIVEAVRNAVDIPVFVKFRTGWQQQPESAADMARRFESAGADALTFHPRVAPDRRTRPPRWEIIRLVKEAVRIPVFGNGNLFEAGDGVRMIRQTGCQGLSVGRAAIARPWIFAQWTGRFSPKDPIFYETALRYTDILLEHFDERSAVRLFKKFAPYFCANFQFGHQMLKRLVYGETMTGIRNNLAAVFESDPRVLETPNINLFL